MDFASHIRTLFQARGRASSYTAPEIGARPVDLIGIRQGGGQRIMVGSLKVSPERTRFHVLRSDVPEPAAGASFEWDGEGFTIDAVQPVERDADGLMWELDCSWGRDVIVRSTVGATTTSFTVRAAVSSYTAEEYKGTVQVADRRLVILQSALHQAGMTVALKAGDRITMEGKTFSTVSAIAIYQAGGFYAWELQLRSG